MGNRVEQRAGRFYFRDRGDRPHSGGRLDGSFAAQNKKASDLGGFNEKNNSLRNA